jgi:hypothetical protein
VEDTATLSSPIPSGVVSDRGDGAQRYKTFIAKTQVMKLRLDSAVEGLTNWILGWSAVKPTRITAFSDRAGGCLRRETGSFRIPNHNTMQGESH